MREPPFRADVGALTVGSLAAGDLDDADRIFRLAFGTFLQLPDPSRFGGDADYVRTRFAAAPANALAARRNGTLVGSCFVTRWGSFAFFGPLSVHPDAWGTGVAQALLAPTLARLDAPGVTLAGLGTFAESPKHVGLYQSFGFWPQRLTMLMTRTVAPGPAPAAGTAGRRFSALDADAERDALAACRALADGVYPGLDPTPEITATRRLGLGDTLLVDGPAGLRAFAVYHCGAGTEAGSRALYVKLAAVAPGPDAPGDLARLLAACEDEAAGRGVPQVLAGVNSARTEAYAALRARGYRTAIQLVAMLRPDAPGFNRPDAFVLDDWR